VTDLFISLLFFSILAAFSVVVLLNNSLGKSFGLETKSLFLIIVLTFAGIQITVTLPKIFLLKIWLVSNLIIMWFIYYNKKTTKDELFYRNNFKFLKSKKRKNFTISCIISYLISVILLNYYIIGKYIDFFTKFKLTMLVVFFTLFIIEIINLAWLLTVLNFYYLPKVTIWGENLTKYEGWLIEESRHCYTLKEKYSGKLLTVKKDAVNQIIIIDKSFC